MKKVLLLAISCFAVLSSYAQTFTVPKDTIKVSMHSNTLEAHNNITTAYDTVIRWSVLGTNFPAGWTTPTALGICDNYQCYQNYNDTLTNGWQFISNTYTANLTGDFHIVLDLTNATETGTYYLSVEMKCGSTTDTSTFLVSRYPTSVASTPKADNGISLYPNPAKDVLNLKYSGSDNIKMVSVFNVIGKNVLNARVNNNNATLNIDQLPAGVYYLRIINSKGTLVATRRFTHQ